MRIVLFFFLTSLLMSCGSSNFAKRKYTKGVYVEKRNHGKVKKSTFYSESVKNIGKEEKSSKKSNFQAKNRLNEPKNDKKELIFVKNENLNEIVGSDIVSESDKFDIEEEVEPIDPETQQLEDGEYLFKDNKKKKLETHMKIWSIMSIAFAVIIIAAIFVLTFIFGGNPTSLVFLAFYFPIPTGITGAVLSSRFKKYYDKSTGNLFLLLSLLAIGITVAAAIILFLLFI